MKTLILSLICLLGSLTGAQAQTYDLWLFDGVGPAPTAVTAKGFAGLSSATVQATATTTNAGYIYRKSDWSNKWTTNPNPVNTALTFANAGGSGSPDGRFSAVTGRFYTFNVPTVPVVGNTTQPFAILETATAPVTISSVTRDIVSPSPADSPTITVTLSGSPGVDQLVYIRYSTTNWSTSNSLPVTISGTSGTVSIPAQTEGTLVSYYALTTPVSSGSWGANVDILTLKVNNNAGTNYNYTSATAADVTPPSTVSDLTASSDPDLNKITLSWTPVTEDNFDTYEIFYSTTGTVTETDSKFDKNTYASLGTRTTSTVTLTGLSWGTGYTFKIRGVDQAENKGTLSNQVTASTAAEPLIIMDGLFDGEEKWGAPAGTADGIAGWFDVNAKKIYVTHDDTYVYFGAEVDYASWQKWVFLINTVSDAGGSVSAANDAATYAHSQLPDFALVQNGTGATLKVWNGSAWTDHATALTEDVWTKFTTAFVEVRVTQAMLNNALSGDVQFYISGNNPGEHSSFDSVPDDLTMTSWNNPLNLSNYVSAITLPVELVTFTATRTGSSVTLKWVTASEKNNYGWEIQKKLSGWETIGFVPGNGTTTQATSYRYLVENSETNEVYRLKQIDLDGTCTFSGSVETGGSQPGSLTISNYPNPFNPSTRFYIRTGLEGTASLQIINLLGQTVRTLSVEVKAGDTTLDANFSDLASGVYFYHLKLAGQIQSGRMSVLK